MRQISVAIVSPPVGTRPETAAYSFVFDEAYRLVKKGVNVHIVRGLKGGTFQSNGIYFHDIEKMIETQALGLTLKNLKTYPQFLLLRKPATIYWENLRVLSLLKIIKEYKIDLIHAHFAYPEGVVALLAKRKTKKPLVVTVHGNDILVDPYTRYGMRLSRRIDASIRWVLNGADLVMAASGATFNEARRITRENSKVHLVPNAVDTERFHPNINSSWLKKKLCIENCSVVFSLRNHRPVYGIEYLIRAAYIVTKQKDNVVFVIGGDGPLRSYHEQLVVELGIKEKIIFVGEIQRDQTPYYFGMSDIVVVPSVQEAFGLVVCEAMASGKPVVGSRVGGIPDQIIDGYTGFLVQPKNPLEIAERILWLIDNPSVAKHMGRQGREIVKRKFNIEKRIEAILSLYEKVLEKQGQP